MESLLPLVVTASKLSSVHPVGLVIVVLGVVLFASGWVWLIYQNYRFSPIHGILSIIPLWALVYGFLRMEHAHKEPWISACVGGIAVAAIGSILVFAAQICEDSDACMKGRGNPEAVEQVIESDSTSYLAPPTTFDLLSC